MRAAPNAVAISAVIFGAVCTATSPIFVRLSELDSSVSAFHRMLWALPFLLLWGRLTRAPSQATSGAQPQARNAADTSRKSTTLRSRSLLIFCGLLFAGDLIALHASIERTTAANAILFLNAQPIYVVIGAWIVFRETVSPRFLMAMGLAIIGSAGVTWFGARAGTGTLFGDALGVLAGLFYATYILTASRLRDQYSSATINAWTCAVGAPALAVVSLLSADVLWPSTLTGWSLVVALGVVAHALGQGLIVWGLAHIPTQFSSVALLVAPVATALFAAAFLDEALIPPQWICMAIVLLAIQLAWFTRKPST